MSRTSLRGHERGRVPFIYDGGKRKFPVDFVDRQIAEAMKPFETGGTDSAHAPEAAQLTRPRKVTRAASVAAE